MERDRLFDQMRRLLEFSGGQVTEVSLTEDGLVFDAKFENEDVRVFITKQKAEPVHLELLDAENY